MSESGIGSSFSKMASWIEELFPPKFKVNDLFEDVQPRPPYVRSNERSRQIYDDVFEEMLKDKPTQQDDKQEQVIAEEEDVIEEVNTVSEGLSLFLPRFLP
jgi:hypothetical protein